MRGGIYSCIVMICIYTINFLMIHHSLFTKKESCLLFNILFKIPTIILYIWNKTLIVIKVIVYYPI